MSEYTRWQMLNESLGFPLGVTSLANIGMAGQAGFGLEEGKTKKKMGGELGIGGPEDDDKSDISLSSDDDDDDDDVEDHDDGGCKCPDADNADIEMGKTMMCKKCKKMKKYMKKNAGKKKNMSETKKNFSPSLGAAAALGGAAGVGGKMLYDKVAGNMKKNMKGNMKNKNMKKESSFNVYQKVTFEKPPEIGSEEYRKSFFKSINDHFHNPDKKHGSGINLGEEVVFKPRGEDEENASLTEPQPGEPGFAPATRIGGAMNDTPPPRSDWEQRWTQVSESVEEIKNMMKQLEKN